MAEDQNTEYKESWRDEYLRQICGLANTHGGSLLVGVDDNGKVVGVRNAKKLQEDIPNKVRETLGIATEVVAHTEDGNEYIEVKVEANATPVSYKNKFYYRSGTVTTELTGSSLHSFLIERMGGQWDAMPVNGATIDDLDRESFDIFKREALRSGRMSERDFPQTRKELLEKLHLLTDDGRLTRAAVMLFHRDPERWVTCAFCKVALFANEADIIYHDEVHGSLMMQADRMIDLIYTKYLVARIDYDGKLRQETYPYPKDAVREGFYNALMHNYYANCAAIQVRINPTNMWITNNLVFNSPWTPERLMSPHASQPYNPLIANTFFRAGFVEAWGRGIQEMCRKCVSHGCPSPHYIDFPQAVMLCLEAHPETISIQRNATDGGQKSDDGYTKGGMKSGMKSGMKGGMKSGMKSGMKNEYVFDMNRGLLAFPKTSTIGKVFAKLQNDPYISIKALSELTGINRSAIQKHLDKLKEYGIIRRVGPDKGGHWECINTSIQKYK